MSKNSNDRKGSDRIGDLESNMNPAQALNDILTNKAIDPSIIRDIKPNGAVRLPEEEKGSLKEFKDRINKLIKDGSIHIEDKEGRNILDELATKITAIKKPSTKDHVKHHDDLEKWTRLGEELIELGMVVNPSTKLPVELQQYMENFTKTHRAQISITADEILKITGMVKKDKLELFYGPSGKLEGGAKERVLDLIEHHYDTTFRSRDGNDQGIGKENLKLVRKEYSALIDKVNSGEIKTYSGLLKGVKQVLGRLWSAFKGSGTDLKLESSRINNKFKNRFAPKSWSHTNEKKVPAYDDNEVGKIKEESIIDKYWNALEAKDDMPFINCLKKLTETSTEELQNITDDKGRNILDHMIIEVNSLYRPGYSEANERPSRGLLSETMGVELIKKGLMPNHYVQLSKRLYSEIKKSSKYDQFKQLKQETSNSSKEVRKITEKLTKERLELFFNKSGKLEGKAKEIVLDQIEERYNKSYQQELGKHKSLGKSERKIIRQQYSELIDTRNKSGAGRKMYFQFEIQKVASTIRACLNKKSQSCVNAERNSPNCKGGKEQNRGSKHGRG